MLSNNDELTVYETNPNFYCLFSVSKQRLKTFHNSFNTIISEKIIETNFPRFNRQHTNTIHFSTVQLNTGGHRCEMCFQ